MSYERLFGNLDALSEHNYLSLSTKLENGEISGFICTDIVLEDIPAYSLLAFRLETKEHGPGWIRACADDFETMYARAILLNDAVADEPAALLIYGNVRNDNWSFVNRNIYTSADTPGELVDVSPSYAGSYVQQVGILEAPNQIFFTFAPVWLYNLDYS